MIKYRVVARKRRLGPNIKSNVLLLCTTGVCCFQSLKMTSLWLLQCQTLHSSLLHSVYCFTCVFSWTPSISRDVGGSSKDGCLASNSPVFPLGARKMKSLLPLSTIGVSYPRQNSIWIMHTKFVARAEPARRETSVRVNLIDINLFVRIYMPKLNEMKAVCHRLCLPLYTSDEWVLRRRALRKLNAFEVPAIMN